jgi:hypothetical protein
LLTEPPRTGPVVHHGRITARFVAGAVLVAAVLTSAGCGGGSSSSSSTPQAGSTGSSATPSTPTASVATTTEPSPAASTVAGVTLTAEGRRLRLGQAARVSWHPHQKTVGVLGLTVRSLARVPISAFADWQLDLATQQSTPYFVRATARNLGRSDLSGVAVPLYLLDGRNTLLQASTFRAQFRDCPSRPFPPGFRHGRKASVCLVYFAPHHGKLTAISFRPSERFDAITWHGPLSKPPAG